MQTLPPIRFYLLLFIILVSVTVLPAQIVYTDVIPDQTINNNGVYHLDMNNDNIIDFDISYTAAFAGVCSDIAQVNYLIRITPAHANAIANDSIISILPIKLDSNDIIDKTLTWKKDSGQLLFSMNWQCFSEYWIGVASGQWINTSNKFLPLKLRLAGNSYFGWLGIDVNGFYSSFGSFRIKDYAFNTSAGRSILAGETTCTEPSVTISPVGVISFCSGDSAVLTATANAYKYQWRKDGVNIIGATSPTYTATTSGTYRVKVTNSCGGKLSKCKVVTTPCKSGESVSTTDELEHLSVYPNPAVKSITVHLPSDDESIIQIINLFGETVFTAQTTSGELTVDVNNFAAGIYTVRWESTENAQSKTFSVVK